MASSLATGIPSASKYTCPCLNVTIFARQGINSHTLVPVDPRDFTDINATHLSQKIFEGSTRVAEIEIDVGGIRSELELLFSTNTIGNWSFFHCLNCKVATHCIRFGTSPSSQPLRELDVDNYNPHGMPTHSSPNLVNAPIHRVLLNITHMISDQKRVAQLEQSIDFSPLFRVVLPTMWTPQRSNERRISGSTDNTCGKFPTSPTSPTSFQPNSGRRLSSNLSPSSSEKLDPTYQHLSTVLHEELRSFLTKEDEVFEKKIKEFTDELRQKFDTRAEKARRDRTYLLNLIRARSLDQSAAVKSLRADRKGSTSSRDGADEVFHKAPSRRESAPTRPINIGANPFPAQLGTPQGAISPPYGGLVEVNRGSAGHAPSSALQPITLTLPLQNRNISNNNFSSPRDQRSHRGRPGHSSPPAGLFAMDDEEDEVDEEEEELEDLGAIGGGGEGGSDSPFEAVETSDGETDPDDNSLEDLRRAGPVIAARSGGEDRERKLSKYSTSAPMNIAMFPQLGLPYVDSPLEEAEADEEFEGFKNQMQQQDARPPSPDPDQIAASMQALAMSQRDGDDPEAIFGELPRRRVNTLDLIQNIRIATARSNALAKKKAKALDSEDDDNFDGGF